MRRDRFREAVGGVAFAALLTFAFLLAGEWDQSDMGLSRIEEVR